MNPYVWIGIAIALLVLTGGTAYEAYTHGEKHVQTAWDLDKAARDSALAKAQYAVLDAQNKAQQVSQAVTVQYETKLKDSAAASAALSALVVRYETVLRRGSVPAVPRPTGSPATAPEVPASDGGIDAAASDAISACGSDAAQLQALIDWNNGIVARE